ncbi:MAG: YdeI/OmpD-associated family protein [Boseongicola sp.]|nr:YdeI/OmpD-associated family protein [Boseongicola sp.]MDD9978156.1 YdeI/OmpD-associated family protein [Boseongicola sp.]
MARPLQDKEEVEVLSRADLRSWLENNHTRTNGIWLVHHKKLSGHYLPMGDIVAECLAFGWVDSLSRGKDDLRTMHWIAPRKHGSNWSAVNKRIVADLEATNLMTEAGRNAINAAKADGSWSRLDSVERLEIPDDLANAFEKQPGSLSNWDAFPRSVKRGALEILINAKQPSTRVRKIEEIVSCSARNERPFQWRSE